MLLSVFTFLSYIMGLIMLILFLAPFVFGIQDIYTEMRNRKKRRKK